MKINLFRRMSSTSSLIIIGACALSVAQAHDNAQADLPSTQHEAIADHSTASPHDVAQPIIYPTTPSKRADGERWRIGYVDGGDYDEYSDTLRALVLGLQALGWLSISDIPTNLDGHQLWRFLAVHTKSDYLEFVSDAWWQPGNFDDSKRPAMRQAIAQRVSTAHDIDLIIAMGTWAGQDMVALRAPVPTIVAAASDPVQTHIIHSPRDSGLDNLLAGVEPERYERQLRVFHEVVPFKRLGIVFENTPEGKTYSALSAARQVARERGFALVTCHAPWNNVALSQATQNVLDCYRRLAPDIDAAYVTAHRGITRDSIKLVARLLQDAQIPSFSMLGAPQVRQGILLSLAQADVSYTGMFYAKAIARIFNGAQARQLNQIWMDPARLVINLHTARLIGFDPPVDTLLAADEIVDD